MPKAPQLKPWSVSTPVPAASFTSLLFVVVIVGCVYVGREVLVPMALAILLSFALTPPVELLQRLYVPRVWLSSASFSSPLLASSVWAV